jgi:hypothetical protein
MTETMTEDTAQRFEVKDGQRTLTFSGWLLAEADSQSGHDVRWTELTLYKTLTGKYVLEKIGRSDVFHADRCKRRSKGVKFDTLEYALSDDQDDALEAYFQPCDQCRPAYDEEPVWVERDISAIALFDAPTALVDSLFRRDGDNMRFLSRVSRNLLDQAKLRDTGIDEVMRTPTDVT